MFQCGQGNKKPAAAFAVCFFAASKSLSKFPCVYARVVIVIVCAFRHALVQKRLAFPFALMHNLVHETQIFKRYRCNHSFDSGRYVAGRDCRSDRSRPINRFQMGRRARSWQREVACIAAVAGKEARRFFGSGIPPMNSPAIPSERALARQGQMPRVLLGGAVRPFVATAHGADSDLPSQRPAADYASSSISMIWRLASSAPRATKQR